MKAKLINYKRNISFTADIDEDRAWVRYSDGNDGEKNYYRDVYDEKNGCLLYCDGESCDFVSRDRDNRTLTLKNNNMNDNDFNSTFTISNKQFIADFVQNTLGE